MSKHFSMCLSVFLLMPQETSSGKMNLAALTQLCHPQIQFQLRSMNLLKTVHKQPTAATLLKRTYLSLFDSQKNK